MCNGLFICPFGPFWTVQGPKICIFGAFLLCKHHNSATTAPIYVKSSLLEASRVVDVQRSIHLPVWTIADCPVAKSIHFGAFLFGKNYDSATTAPIYIKSSLLDISGAVYVQRPVHWPIIAQPWAKKHHFMGLALHKPYFMGVWRCRIFKLNISWKIWPTPFWAWAQWIRDDATFYCNFICGTLSGVWGVSSERGCSSDL